MLVPQLHDELTSAAARPRLVRRVSSRTARAVLAALLTLLIAAPAAQAALSAQAPAGLHGSMEQSA